MLDATLIIVPSLRNNNKKKHTFVSNKLIALIKV